MATNSWQQSAVYPPHPHFLGVPSTYFNQRRMSPWELIKMNYDPGLCEDTASNSSSSAGSTALESIDSLPLDPCGSLRKHKKRSYHVLLKEIRRLRAENDSLRNMVDTIREDLRYERDSRQISEQCHLKYFNESADRQIELEDDVADKQKLIDDLKQRIQDLEASAAIAATTSTPSISSVSPNHPLAACRLAAATPTTTSASTTTSSTRWGCFDFDDDEMLCQPLVGDSAIPDMPFVDRRHTPSNSSSDEDEDDRDHSVYHSSYDNDDEDDEDDDDGLTDNERFESLASSYLRQAIVSKLTSARANLELDDLMLKYDPSPAVILRTLAGSFVSWLGHAVVHGVSKLDGSATKAWTTGVTEGGFLDFWKAILEKHVHDEADQTQFLNEAERLLEKEGTAATAAAPSASAAPALSSSALVDNYHYLLVMLYKYDIIDADAISAWWHAGSSSSSNALANRLRGVTRGFKDWLEQDDDDDDEDDEDDDDDEEEEEEKEMDHSDSDTVIDYHDQHAHDQDEHTDMEIDTQMVNHMLQEDADRNCCACQFESGDSCMASSSTPTPIDTTLASKQDTTAHTIATPTTTTTVASPCKCEPSYTPSPSEKKPKKTVRIML